MCVLILFCRKLVRVGEFGVCSDDPRCGGAEAASSVWREGGALFCWLSRRGLGGVLACFVMTLRDTMCIGY